MLFPPSGVSHHQVLPLFRLYGAEGNLDVEAPQLGRIGRPSKNLLSWELALFLLSERLFGRRPSRNHTQLLNFQDLKLQRLCLWRKAEFAKMEPAAQGKGLFPSGFAGTHGDVRKLDRIGRNRSGAVGRRTGGRLRWQTGTTASDQSALPLRSLRFWEESSGLRPARRGHATFAQSASGPGGGRRF